MRWAIAETSTESAASSAMKREERHGCGAVLTEQNRDRVKEQVGPLLLAIGEVIHARGEFVECCHHRRS